MPPSRRVLRGKKDNHRMIRNMTTRFSQIHITAMLIALLAIATAPSAAQAQSADAKPAAPQRPKKDAANNDDREFTRLLHEDVEIEELEAASSAVEGDWTPEQHQQLEQGGNLLPEMIAVGGVTRRTADGLQLSEPEHQTGVMTPQWYHAPVRIRAVAKTDSSNLRLYFGRGMVIYNWEVNPAELRYHDPTTGQQTGVPDQGAVPTNEFVTLTWEVLADRTRLLVNDEVRYEEEGNFTHAAGHIGFGAAWGSVVTVKSLTVERVNPVVSK